MLPLLELVISFLLVVNALTLVLDIRQLRAIQRPSAPPSLASLYSQEKYLACQSYRWVRRRVSKAPALLCLMGVT